MENMKSHRDSCCAKLFNVEWMWKLVTNRTQIKKICGIIV